MQKKPHPIITKYQSDCLAWQRENWMASYVYSPRVPSILIQPVQAAMAILN